MLGILAALLVGTLLGALTDRKNVSKVGKKHSEQVKNF